MKKNIIMLVFLSIICSLASLVIAGPQSTTYELKEFGFGSGGTTGNDSSNYTLFGTSGEIDTGKLDSTTYTSGNGLIFTMISNVPPAPTFSNPSNYYDRLKFVLDTGGNPSDTKFAIAISQDDFTTTQYIQSDATVGSSLGSEDWQTYTAWGGATGTTITGLTPNTTYKIKVKAEQGDFSESPWGPTASASTVLPSLSFGISSPTLTFTNLSSSNSWTDSSKTTTLTTTTNANNGYIIYGRDTAPLTYNSNTIANYASPNSSPTIWSGTGFGYTTDDSNLTGGTTDRFTNGGPKYAGFGTSAPGDPVADNTGPASSEVFTISYRVTANATTPAGKYQTTVLYVIVPTY